MREITLAIDGENVSLDGQLVDSGALDESLRAASLLVPQPRIHLLPGKDAEYHVVGRAIYLSHRYFLDVRLNGIPRS